MTADRAIAGLKWAAVILVLALFFVVLNLVVDIVQSALDPRLQRG